MLFSIINEAHAAVYREEGFGYLPLAGFNDPEPRLDEVRFDLFYLAHPGVEYHRTFTPTLGGSDPDLRFTYEYLDPPFNGDRFEIRYDSALSPAQDIHGTSASVYASGGIGRNINIPDPEWGFYFYMEAFLETGTAGGGVPLPVSISVAMTVVIEDYAYAFEELGPLVGVEIPEPRGTMLLALGIAGCVIGAKVRRRRC